MDETWTRYQKARYLAGRMAGYSHGTLWGELWPWVEAGGRYIDLEGEGRMTDMREANEAADVLLGFFRQVEAEREILLAEIEGLKVQLMHSRRREQDKEAEICRHIGRGI